MIESSRDVIIRTDAFEQAVRFYEKILGFAVASRSESLVGFDTGAFRLYVEKGEAHGPVFDYLADDVAASRDSLLRAGCTMIEEDAGIPRCYLRDPYGVTFNVGLRNS